MNFKQFRVSKNVLNVQGSTSLIGTSITVNNDNTITDRNISSGAADRIYWAHEFDSGTYTFSASTSGGITQIRVYSNKEFAGGTYNQYYNGWYCDVNDSLTFAISDSFIFGIIIVGSGSGTISNIMLNSGSTPLPYEPYGNTWTDTPHYIHNTSTDTITTLPAVLYPNDTTATVGLKGDMSQTGTPSPTTPIQPSECGDLSENLYNASNPNIFKGYYGSVTNSLIANPTNAFIYIPLVQGRKYYVYGCKRYNTSLDIRWVTTSSTPLHDVSCIRTGQFAQTGIFTITAEANENYLAIFLCGDSDYSTYGTVEDAIATNGANLVIDNGYKIPILNNSQTTNVYLGEVQSTRRISKYEMTGSEDITYQSAYSRFFFTRTDAYYSGTVRTTPCVCSHYQSIHDGRSIDDVPNESIYVATADNKTAFNIKTTDFTDVTDFKAYLAQQYTNGTPVTIWYILATPETAVVNEPIRKIGTYADEVSGITIPTIAGANTLSIGTTLQPSEVSVTYKGWHSVADVHERESGQWD